MRIGDLVGGPIENQRDLPKPAAMGKRPGNGLFAAIGVAGNGIVERKFESAFGGIGDGLNSVFEVEPAFGLAFAIALKAAETLGAEQEFRTVRLFSLRAQ